MKIVKKYWWVLVLVVVAFLLYKEASFDKVKIGYVDLETVYDRFTLKKELEKELKTFQERSKNELDSLNFLLQLHTDQYKQNNDKSIINKVDSIKSIIYYKNKKYTDGNERLSYVYDNQIWQQLNQYMKEYGELNDYTYILGADGSGSLIYAEESENITEDILIYINNAYATSK